ncbi:CBS domain-containing protein [Halomonas sp. CUBES01]|uniref:CBS domain-containing protein n=1 Tax=Vreelandella gomseomensis TaxID=370766 RepID=A0ABU1GA28_9GAMM|nr:MULTISPECIES: CBS domain-containing protein [Halomonas]MDR5874352.1 CBS domain-containing protein [Halomonas gomseomensis]MEC4765742.1 CBS domain-containing protein [Halomonas sp. CUBES01]MEC4769010.1 CBS domain-containing protein [Halomonas sp. CUBES01]MEC4769024.1 CBS domain-containing protein [Halomonas sp. CUBES01]
MNQATFSPKPLIQLGSTPLLAMPAARRLAPTSPAMAVLTDFSQVVPQSVDADTPIDEAHLKMRYGGVRLLFVMDTAAHCIGIVTSKEVIGTRRINIAMQQRNLSREDITAEMVMTPWHKLSAMPIAQLASLTIEDLVLSMEAVTDQHLLITEQNDDHELRIRGLVSATDIQNAIGKEISPVPRAKSFADICQVITGHDL